MMSFYLDIGPVMWRLLSLNHKETEGQRGNGLVQDSVPFGSCTSKLVPFPPYEGTWNGFRGKLGG